MHSHMNVKVDSGLVQHAAMCVDANISDEPAVSVFRHDVSSVQVQATSKLKFSQPFSPVFFKTVLRVDCS